ncbi:hypothetical protein BCEN4_370043 [Burkholderia cenocepacia]|nr:hypothetical protein BCEN4_370043 [Burkholderia cenocepacia]
MIDYFLFGVRNTIASTHVQSRSPRTIARISNYRLQPSGRRNLKDFRFRRWSHDLMPLNPKLINLSSTRRNFLHPQRPLPPNVMHIFRTSLSLFLAGKYKFLSHFPQLPTNIN